jgi:integrase
MHRHSHGRWDIEHAQAVLDAANETIALWGDEIDYGELADDLAIEARLALSLSTEIHELEQRIEIMRRALDPTDHPERLSREFERKQATYNRLNPDSPLPRLRLHDLRHTWATLALAAGVHPKVVQERLGHTSINTTMDVYSHAMPGMQSQAAEQVSAMIFGA